jgi:hypothetical protein
MRARPFTWGLVLAFFSVACGGGAGSSSGADTAQKAVTDTNTRIDGTWTLVQFEPTQPLEPMFAALLAAQLNQLKVTFHAGRMTVEGVGVTAERSFIVTHAAADGFDATVTDPTNVSYVVSGAFQGSELSFTSKSDPWRGQGRLRRAP